jgi:transcription elongation factor Elf1
LGGGVDRNAAFKDERVQALISSFLSGNLRVINPIFDLRHGFRYPIVEEIVGGPPKDRKFLDELYEAGVLRRELYDRIIYCPSCGSPNVSTLYCCPYCRSIDIRRSSLVEHVECGYIDTEEKFNAKGKLICPKCHKELIEPEIDYREAGVWCTCNKCGKSFDIPVPTHFCRECGERFPFEKALIEDAYAYSLNEEVVKSASLEWTVLAPIRSFMEERGFEVESPGFINGRSGVKHMFNIVAHGRGTKRKVIVVNVSISGSNQPVPSQSIIEMFAKTYDSAIDRAFFIAIPRTDPNGRKLAKLYKISLIEAKNPDEAIEKLKQHLPD